MFDIGDLLFYGTNGVCRVSEICASPFDLNDTRQFYKLTPIAENSSLVIYTPVDNTQIIMRPLISKEEAEALVARIPDIEKVSVAVEKHRKEAYRDTIREGDPEGYVKIIKTVRARREYFKRTRRRVPYPGYVTVTLTVSADGVRTEEAMTVNGFPLYRGDGIYLRFPHLSARGVCTAIASD